MFGRLLAGSDEPHDTNERILMLFSLLNLEKNRTCDGMNFTDVT